MSIYNPLGWQNENGLSNYPFAQAQEINDLIVDAKFLQFDHFIPTLDYIVVAVDRLELGMTFDYGTNTGITLLKSDYADGDNYRNVRIYTTDNSRYLGVLVFGTGAAELWKNHIGRKIVYNAAFLPEVLTSIPSKDAVYSFDGNYGDIHLSRTTSDSTIFYNTSLDLNAITMNAVGGHAVANNAKKEGLRKINLVPPLHNNINLVSNDVIKIKSFNSSSLTIELVSGTPTQAFVVPTLIA